MTLEPFYDNIVLESEETLEGNRKKEGELAEAKFVVRALEKGLIVASPHGDSSTYDKLVDSGKRILKIQVKSTSVKMDRSYKIHSTKGCTNKRKYEVTDIDILACYIVPLDTWYLIPREVLGDRITLSLFPHIKDSKGIYEQFKEAWHLLAS